MNKFFNKSVILVFTIGLVTTIVLVFSFQLLINKNKQTPEVKEKTTNKQTSDQNSTKTFSDENLGITFKYPADLKIVTDGQVPTGQPFWLEIRSFLVDDLIKDEYWKKNLAKLVIGDEVVLPNDSYIKETILKATIAEYPVVVYTEMSYKNCSENYNDNLVILIDDKLVVLSMRHAPGYLPVKYFKSTSDEILKNCKEKNLEVYDYEKFLADIKNEQIDDGLKNSMNYFGAILSSIEATKVKADINASSTPAIINSPFVSDNGDLMVGVDEVYVLEGDEAVAQMKKDKVCNSECQPPEKGYIVNQTKKIKNLQLDFNSLAVINYSNATTTPVQATKVGLPLLTEFIKQSTNDQPMVFDVYFDKDGQKVIGLKQR